MTQVSLPISHASEIRNLICHQDDVLNAMSIPIITTSRDLTILAVNDAAAELLEMPLEKIITARYDLLFQFMDSRNGDCIAYEAVRTARPVAGQAIARINGRTIPVEYGAIPVADEQGQISSIVNYLVDRSDQQLFFEEVASLGEQVRAGSLDARADLTNFSEPYRSALRSMNGMLDTLTAPLLGVESAAYQIARGSSPILLNSSPGGELGELISMINKLLVSIPRDQTSSSQLTDEISLLKITLEMVQLDLKQLGEGIQTGDFGIRMEGQDYEGVLRSSVETINEGLADSEKILAAISGTLIQIRDGFIPDLITREFPGEFEEMKRYLNDLIGILSQMMSEMDLAEQPGDFRVHPPSDTFSGIYRKIMQGVKK